jgi:hypothetical protein
MVSEDRCGKIGGGGRQNLESIIIKGAEICLLSRMIFSTKPSRRWLGGLLTGGAAIPIDRFVEFRQEADAYWPIEIVEVTG